MSFLVAEEATWDHRFHDLDGRELDAGELELSSADQQLVQTSCDAAVGSVPIPLTIPAANANTSGPSVAIDIAASPA